MIEVEYVPFWRRYKELLRNGKLTPLDRGILLDAMMDYQFDGQLPEDLPDTLLGYWVFIKMDLDYARQQYERSVMNGKKGGRRKKQEPTTTQENPEEGKTISESITESESISESISITEIDQNHASSTEAEEDLSVSKKAYGEYGWVLLSDQEYEQLKQTMGESELKRCIAYIDASAQSTGNRNHWVDWYAVLKRCHQNGWSVVSRRYPQKKEIPKGASGELGEIELNAIQRLLREG